MQSEKVETLIKDLDQRGYGEESKAGHRLNIPSTRELAESIQNYIELYNRCDDNGKILLKQPSIIATCLGFISYTFDSLTRSTVETVTQPSQIIEIYIFDNRCGHSEDEIQRLAPLGIENLRNTLKENSNSNHLKITEINGLTTLTNANAIKRTIHNFPELFSTEIADIPIKSQGPTVIQNFDDAKREMRLGLLNGIPLLDTIGWVLSRCSQQEVISNQLGELYPQEVAQMQLAVAKKGRLVELSGFGYMSFAQIEAELERIITIATVIVGNCI